MIVSKPAFSIAGRAMPVLHRATIYLWVLILTLLVSAGCACAQQGDTGRLKTQNLDSVIVKGHKLAFVIKNDTLEFNAGVVKLLPNAAVIDLLKKLPGVIVGADGTITVNGKKVNKIKVDGRDFFSDNMQAATANLPAEVVDKVQVMETKSVEKQRSLAVQPRGEEVTINLTLKKDKKAGLLGNIAVGAGTQHRYALNGMLNQFGKTTRLSFYGSAGNEGSGRAGGVSLARGAGEMGQQGGFTDNQSGSLNMNTKYGKELTVDAYYNYSRNTANKQTLLNRLNFLQDSSFTYNSDQAERSGSSQHQFSLGIVFEPDSLTVWNWRPTVSFGRSDNTTLNKAFSETITGKPINSLASAYNNGGRQYNIASQLSFNKSTRNRGMNLNIAWAITVNNKDEQQKNKSVNEFYTGGFHTTDSIDQHGAANQQGLTNNIVINLSGKIAKHLVAALDYSLDWNVSNLRKETFNYNPGSRKYDQIDSLLSNNNRNSSITQVPAIQLAYKTDRMSLALNSGIRIIQQENHLLWKDSVIRIRQQQFSPNVQFNYAINKFSNLYAGYTISSSAPSAEQLSPVIDNSNPLYIKAGNPFLQASTTQSAHFGLSGFKPQKGISMHLMGSGSITHNQVVNDIYYDSSGRQVSTYRNVNGTGRLNIMAGMGINKRWSDWSFTSSLNASMAGNRDVSFVSRQRNEFDKLTMGGQLYISIGYKEWVTLSPSANFGWTTSTYSLENIPGADFTNQHCQLQLEVGAIKRLKFSVDISYRYNSQIPIKENRQVTLVNSSLTYRFLSKEQLMLTASVQDIFNRNRYAYTQVMDTYQENIQVNGLRRYGLLTLAWNFNQLHGSRTTSPAGGLTVPVMQ